VLGAARGYLEALESERDRLRAAGNGGAAAAQSELPLFNAAPTPATIASDVDGRIRAALADIDPDGLTPRAALEELYRLRRLLEER
jgi:DNA mismatch repair protein MutS